MSFAFVTAAVTGNTATATPFMATAGAATPPIGHVRFCEANRADCRSLSDPVSEVVLTLETWRELNDVNFTVNTLIRPATDQELYSVPERWEYPELTGDCEDYVLLKRRMLHRAGWPLSALLITVVRDQNGDGHAVLTVRTDRGDLILDNQVGQIVTWDQTPYRYLKRQSERHAARWIAIADDRAAANMAMAQQ